MKYNDILYNVFTTKRKTPDGVIIDVFGEEEAKKMFEWEREQDKKMRITNIKAAILTAYFTVGILVIMLVLGSR